MTADEDLGTVGRIVGGLALAGVGLTTVVVAPILGVPFLGCGAILVVPILAFVWFWAAVLPADLGLPAQRRLPGALAMAFACLCTGVGLMSGLGATHQLFLAFSRGSPLEPSLGLATAALLVLASGVGYAAGFQVRWGLHPALAVLAGSAAAAVVPASCAMLVVYGLLGLPLTA